MCAQAAAVQCGCLDAWGSEWSDIGYRSQQDFFEGCQTWAWEMKLLESDAVSRGELDGPGALESACQDRTAILEAPDLTCDDWSALEWSVVPWE